MEKLPQFSKLCINQKEKSAKKNSQLHGILPDIQMPWTDPII